MNNYFYLYFIVLNLIQKYVHDEHQVQQVMYQRTTLQANKLN